jgi:hypothetical protein
VGRAAMWRVIVLAACALASLSVVAAPAQASGIYLASRSMGYDVSWPNCGVSAPSRQFAIVGVTDGHPFSTNPCLAGEFAAARHGRSAQLYMNITAPSGDTAGMGRTGPAGTCSTVEVLCRAYDYGFNAARAAFVYAVRRVGSAAEHTGWWLDVEFNAGWSKSASVNARSIAGALAFLRAHGLATGIYSTSYQWRHIAGSYHPGVPVWYATASGSASGARVHCAASSGFTGGPVRMVQYTPAGLDADTIC